MSLNDESAKLRESMESLGYEQTSDTGQVDILATSQPPDSSAIVESLCALFPGSTPETIRTVVGAYVRTIEGVRDRLQKDNTALTACLDICLRYAQGEGADGDCAELAVDYGGTGYEKSPACVAVEKLQQDHVKLKAIAAKLHDHLKIVQEADHQAMNEIKELGLPVPEEALVVTRKNQQLLDDYTRIVNEADNGTAAG